MKFLFATTEADKLPVTVLSRCQRFDLRRVSAPQLADHFTSICAAENVAAEPQALAMIAAAAEGSVRDGLSILDQAIAHADLDAGDLGDAQVTADQVREMLGLADRTAQRRMLSALLAGDGAAMLDVVASQYALGVEPVALMRGAMELVHRITVAQVGQSGADALAVEEREAIEGWANTLSAGQLHRLWQLLIKGHDEVRVAPDPLVSAQMALLRVLHAADLPDPGALVRKIEQLVQSGATIPQAGAAPAAADAPAQKLDWETLVAQVDALKPSAASLMTNWVRVIALEPGLLRYALAPGYTGDVAPDLRDGLLAATGERWALEHVDEGGTAEPSLRELSEHRAAEAAAEVRASPLVAAAFAAFPDAEIVTEEPAAQRGERNWSR